MFPYGKYFKYDNEYVFGDGPKVKRQNVWTTDKSGEKVYDYEEAIALTGNGHYNLTLLFTMSLSFLAMGIDMFSFSTVVALSQCDLQIDLQQTTILMCIPFIGPITMAYAWGYIADTQGRRRSLLLAMGCSFIMSVLCAFATDWITLGVFKLIGTCFCSCAQSASYALLGESCAAQHRGFYLLVLGSVVQISTFMYFTPAYLIGNLDFSIDLGFITFVPWRLLAVILALPLGISAVSIMFFYESPKFLLNAGKTEDTLYILREISRRNGLDDFKYPVKRLVINTAHYEYQLKKSSLLSSLWSQTAPLFMPPLLKHTLILYFLTFVVYSTTGALVVWLPFLAEAFTAGVAGTLEGQGLCGMITSNSSDTGQQVPPCISTVGLPIVIFTFISSALLTILNAGLSCLSSRKKTITIVLFLLAALSSAGTQVFRNNIANVILYFGITISMVTTGVISSYFVDLYPTSHLGMASCLGVMVARISSVIGVNWMGPLMLTHCSFIFILWLCHLLTATIVSCLLPSTSSDATGQQKLLNKTDHK